MSVESASTRPELCPESTEQDHEFISAVENGAAFSESVSAGGSHSPAGSHHSGHCASDVSTVTSLKSMSTSRPVPSYSSHSGVCVCVCVCVSTCIYIYMYMFVEVFMCTYMIHMFVCTCIWCVCVCVCVCVCWPGAATSRRGQQCG